LTGIPASDEGRNAPNRLRPFSFPQSSCLPASCPSYLRGEPAAKAIAASTSAGILEERTRRRRDRIYGYRRYLALLSADTELSPTV
jgi:hypothetical protein